MPGKLTKRQALLVLLGTIPVMAFGRQGHTDGNEGPHTLMYWGNTPEEGGTSLLVIDFQTPKSPRSRTDFLVVRVDGKEECRISLQDALDILKGRES